MMRRPRAALSRATGALRTALVAVAVASASCLPISDRPSPVAHRAGSPTSAEPTALAPIGTPDPVPTSVAAPVPTVPQVGLAAPRETRAVGGIDFILMAGRADLYVEADAQARDAADVNAQVTNDVEAIEREFEMRFAQRPVIYVFATTASYATGMSRIFGYAPPTADWIAENSVAFFEPPLGIIGVNWEAVSDRRPIAAIRHELTHLLTLQACGSRCDLVPAWLNEGQARLAEAQIPGADWRLMRVRYESASMAATGTLLPLATLVTQGSWNSLTSWAGYYKYQEAARVTELLREDIGGDAPIARLYERIRSGENIAEAYATLTGRSFESFVAALATRVRAGADAAPGVAAIPTTPEGPGASYLIYGIRPSAMVDVTITGKWGATSARVAVSPFGAVFESFAPDLPRGWYEISVRDGPLTVTASVMKRWTVDGTR